MHPMEYHLEDYTISTDRERLDIDAIHQFLSQEAYWSPGVPREIVEKSIANSLNFGLYHLDRQIGYTRVITDYATFVWIADVFVLPEFRGRGLSKWLISCVRNHPDLQIQRLWLLATTDAHGLYAKFGFVNVDPERFMVIRKVNPYGATD